MAGAIAGTAARLAMWVLRLANPSHNGELTHANAEVGRVTAEGTVSLLTEGMFYGVGGALVYLVVRRWMPGTGLAKGLTFGLYLLAVGAPAVLDGNYEYFRYASTWVGVAMFAALYPLFGLVVSPLTEWLGRGQQGRPRQPVEAWSGSIVLGVVGLVSLGRDIVMLRDVFHLFA